MSRSLLLTGFVIVITVVTNPAASMPKQAAASSPPPLTTPSVASAEAELKALEAERSKAQVAGDIEKLQAMLAPEFMEMNASGNIRTRTDNVQGHQRGAAKWIRFDLTDLHVESHGTTAIADGAAHPRRDICGQRYVRGEPVHKVLR